MFYIHVYIHCIKNLNMNWFSCATVHDCTVIILFSLYIVPFFVPVVLYPVTSQTSFDNRATFILYLLSYDIGRPSLEDVLSLESFSVLGRKKKEL